MLDSISTFCVLFGHALIALGQPPAHSKREAVERAASLAGANPTGFQSILDLREGKIKQSDIDIEVTLRTYLEFVEVLTNEVDRRLETS